MPDLLTLDFVSHVSIVDEPAVPDAEVLVAKRAEGAAKQRLDVNQNQLISVFTDTVQSLAEADNSRTQSQVRADLIQELAEEADRSESTIRNILSGDISTVPEEVADALVTVLEVDPEDIGEEQEGTEDEEAEASKQAGDLYTTLRKSMSDDTDPEALVESMKEAAEQMEDAAEQMEEAAEAQTETTEEGGDTGGSEQEGQGGGSDTDEQSIREEIQELNDRINQEFSTEEETEGEETEEEPDPTEVEVDPEADTEEQVAQMGKKVEAAIKAAGQEGRVGSRTSAGDGDTEKSQGEGLSFRNAVEKHRGSQSEEGEA